MTTFAANIPGWIPQIYKPQVLRGYWYNNVLVELFGLADNPLLSVNGGNVRWVAQTPGVNNAAAVAEGAPALAPNVDSVVRMDRVVQAFEVGPATTYEGTDFAMVEVDPNTAAVEKGAEQLRNVVNATNQTEWENATDVTTTPYYGHARPGTFPRLMDAGSNVAAVAISIPLIETALERMATNPWQVPHSELGIFMTPALAARYSVIANTPIDTARGLDRQQGAPVDGGYGMAMPDKYFTGMRHNGVPIFSVPGQTGGTVIIGPRLGPQRPQIIDPTPILRAKTDDPNAAVVAGIRMVKKDPATRSEYIQMDTYSQLIIPRPGDWFQMTNKT